MKKLFVLGALALATISMSAQDYTGKWFVGGSFGFKSENSKTPKFNETDKYEKNNNFEVGPIVGYFIAPTLAVGGQVSYKGAKEFDGPTADGATKYNSSNFIIAPLVRQYLPLGSSGFNFFGEAKLPVQFGSKKGKANKGGAEISKTTTFDINIEANIGFDYIINEKYSFETSMNLASIGFNSQKDKDVKRSTSFNADINHGQKFGDFRVGFKILF